MSQWVAEPAAAVSPWCHTGSVTRPRRATKGAAGTVGPAPWRSVRRTKAGMSSHRAVATKEQPSGVRRTKMDFWDGMEHAFMMPSITAKGTGIHSHRGSAYRTNSCSVVWVRLGTAAISGVFPSGAGDVNDTLHVAMRHSSGGVGGLRAGRRRAQPGFPLPSRANRRLGRGGWLRSRTAPAAPGGATPASS